MTISEKSGGSHLRCATAWSSEGLQWTRSRASVSLRFALGGFWVQDHGQLPPPGSQPGRKGEAISRFLRKKGKKSCSRPLICTLLSLRPSSPTLLTSPSHIRSSDWPIKHRKYVSNDECSAQAENSQCEADYTSSSITRTADIPQPASTTRAYL